VVDPRDTRYVQHATTWDFRQPGEPGQPGDSNYNSNDSARKFTKNTYTEGEVRQPSHA
jgi:hypothetical protein